MHHTGSNHTGVGGERTATPPAARATLAARRGPPWLIAVLDFLERQLSLATTVEERVSLVRVYARALLSLAGLVLVAALLVAWLLTGTHPWSLLMLAAGGTLTGTGLRLRRRRADR